MAIAHPKGRDQPTQITKASPRTSSDPDKPTELIITPGTPVVDCQHEVFGTIAAVTPSFCILRLGRGKPHYDTCPWEHIAVGNVRPTPAMLPRRAGAKDRLNYLATLLAELEGLRTTVGLTPTLRAARDEVLASLRCG